jgi:hypothetical protein
MRVPDDGDREVALSGALQSDGRIELDQLGTSKHIELTQLSKLGLIVDKQLLEIDEARRTSLVAAVYGARKFASPVRVALCADPPRSSGLRRWRLALISGYG